MSRSFSVGGYTRDIHTQEDPFTSRVMAIKNDDASNLEDTFENWTADRVKEAAKGFERAEQAKAAAAESQKNGDVWIHLHPEYVDNDANGNKMLHELKTMGIVYEAATLQDFEVAYQQLYADGMLTLNQTELRKQKIAADKQRAKEIQDKGGVFSTGISEEEMYNMPLEDLRRLDTIENQKRMQRRGEEGGW